MGACQGPHEVGTLSLVPTPTGVEVLSIVLYAFLQSSVCIFAIECMHFCNRWKNVQKNLERSKIFCTFALNKK